jgi:hypothetical protein
MLGCFADWERLLAIGLSVVNELLLITAEPENFPDAPAADRRYSVGICPMKF